MKLVLLAVLLGIVVFQADADGCSPCPDGLTVWVHSGYALTGDGFENPEPYVVIKVGSAKKQTTWLSSTNYPSWRQKLFFPNVHSNEIITEVWDKDKGIEPGRGDDDKIGTCKQLIYPGKRSFQCRPNGHGLVKLSYDCP